MSRSKRFAELSKRGRISVLRMRLRVLDELLGAFFFVACRESVTLAGLRRLCLRGYTAGTPAKPAPSGLSTFRERGRRGVIDLVSRVAARLYYFSRPIRYRICPSTSARIKPSTVATSAMASRISRILSIGDRLLRKKRRPCRTLLVRHILHV